MTWKTNLLFIISATLLTLLSGWLIGSNILPIHLEINYSQAERNFVNVWIQVAIWIGLLLPGIAFLVWIRRPEMRTLFGFYLLVLAVQIVTEHMSSHVFSPSLVVIIGTLYTGFRLWQLWQGQRFLRAHVESSPSRGFFGVALRPRRVAHGLLWLLLLFWSVNLIFLLVVALPGIL